MRVKSIEFEGTVDEYRVFAASQAELSGTDKKATPLPKDDQAITPDEVRHIFTRLPLSNGQRSFLSCIYESGEKGALASEARAKTGITPAQFAGVLGAFGRRVANSFTGKKFSLFNDILTWKWEEIEESMNAEYRYWLSEPARQAIDEFDLL